MTNYTAIETAARHNPFYDGISLKEFFRTAKPHINKIEWSFFDDEGILNKKKFKHTQICLQRFKENCIKIAKMNNVNKDELNIEINIPYYFANNFLFDKEIDPDIDEEIINPDYWMDCAISWFLSTNQGKQIQKCEQEKSYAMQRAMCPLKQTNLEMFNKCAEEHRMFLISCQERGLFRFSVSSDGRWI